MRFNVSKSTYECSTLVEQFYKFIGLLEDIELRHVEMLLKYFAAIDWFRFDLFSVDRL